MSSSIRISEETKRKLEARKREGETFDELLSRLARTDRDVEELAGWGTEDETEALREHLERTEDDLSESLNKHETRRG